MGPGMVRSSHVIARPSDCTAMDGMIVAKWSRFAWIVSARSGMISTISTNASSPATSSES